jgi:hypothetical protein
MDAVRAGDNFFHDEAKQIGDDLQKQRTDVHRLRTEVLWWKHGIQYPKTLNLKHKGVWPLILTKICPSTAPKQESPMPRNHILKVKAGRLGSSSRDMRRVATSISVSEKRG